MRPEMPAPKTGHEIDDTAFRLARLVAGDYARSPEFKGYSREDIEQDLLLHLLEKAPLFNPAVNDDWERFVRARLEERAKDMLKLRRGRRSTAERERTVDLDQVVGEDESGDPVFLSETIPSKEPSVADEVALRLDLAEAMKRLPDGLASIARRMGAETQAEIAADLGMTPVQFHRQCATPIRRALQSV